MKKTLIAVSTALLSCLSLAEPAVVPAEQFKVPEVAKALAQKCQPQCIILDRADWAALQEQVNLLIQQAIRKDRTGST